MALLAFREHHRFLPGRPASLWRLAALVLWVLGGRPAAGHADDTGAAASTETGSKGPSASHRTKRRERSAAHQTRMSERATLKNAHASNQTSAATTDGQEVPATPVTGAKKARASHSKTEPDQPRTRLNGVSLAYDRLQRSWHAPASLAEEQVRNAVLLPALVVRVVHHETEPPFVLFPLNDQGDFSPEEREKARLAWGGSEGQAVHPRTLSLVYRAMRHFNAPHIHLISGIRRDRGGSRHTHGYAADVVIPGVSDETLAKYFRAQGFVGVGVYTRARFVHVDTREESFFWLDRSLPGKKGGKIQQILKEEAAEMDKAAIARGEHPEDDTPKLARALELRARKLAKTRRAKRDEAKIAAVQPHVTASGD
ncbi:MAG: hypothetical protein RL385_2017 [Pseudomonadota bacterium]|jgi:hypothetical protein